MSRYVINKRQKTKDYYLFALHLLLAITVICFISYMEDFNFYSHFPDTLQADQENILYYSLKYREVALLERMD